MDIFSVIPNLCGALPAWVHIALWIGFALSHVVHYYVNIKSEKESANEVASKNSALTDADLNHKLTDDLPS